MTSACPEGANQAGGAADAGGGLLDGVQRVGDLEPDRGLEHDEVQAGLAGFGVDEHGVEEGGVLFEPGPALAGGRVAAAGVDGVLLAQVEQTRHDVAGVGLADEDDAAAAAGFLGLQLVEQGALGGEEAGGGSME